MFPPVPTEVLTKNPQFKELYTQLTTKIPNPHDGSTREAREAEAAATASLEQELRTYRAELARMEIVKDSLLKLTGQNNGFTDEINDIIDIVATHTIQPTSLSTAHSGFLAEELEDFQTCLPLIAQALSHHLTELAISLSTIAFPAEPPPATAAARQQRIELLPAHAAHRCALLVEKRAEVEKLRVELAGVAQEVGEEWKKVGERGVKFLEEVKFGTVERVVRGQAEVLEGVVEGMEGKLDVMKLEALAAIYNPESLNALENYHHHLVDTRSRLEARQRTVEQELKLYDRAGSDMKALVARYSTAVRGIETVTKEIRRLGGNV
ncbi:hypothetical protein EV426DRAFT_10746 [Tirmania nivea]|nr:hypothetical protein EV426DRAFT_10746 [Tirmania nivea]